MEIFLSPEELSDLEDQFLHEYSDSIEKYETAMTELFKAGQYQAFIAVTEQVKAFFLSFGPGGEEYYKNTWSDDPRLARAKNALAMQGKYAEGASLENVCIEILAYIRENSPVYAGEVFKMFSAFPRDLIVKSLSKLCKNRQVVKDYDSGGRKIYILP